jgi:sarcosine oxidase, subunit alpha
VTIYFDGEPVLAERGEPAAVALIAAGQVALARSPKFHRPRGPACLRGACDGCLARVDDEPNVMTCRVPVAEGMRIEAQNVVGSKDTDLLRVTDWFFPEGLNHHELFAGVPGLQPVLQGFARRVAGLGKLPARERPARAAQRRGVDALVVGAGPAGMAAAAALAARGREVEVVDDDLTWGGGARLLLDAGERSWARPIEAFGAAVAGSRVRVRPRTTAAGIYGDDVLLAGDDGGGLEVVDARTLVLAPGAHDGTLAFEGNDVPGVLSARAGCALIARGVAPGAKVVVASVAGGGPFGRAFALADPSAITVSGTPLRVSGSARARAVTLATAAGERRLTCDAVLVDAPSAPAYELCAQAGAELSHTRRGFFVRTGEGGRLRAGVFAIGEVTGAALDPEALARDAMALAARSATR